MPLYDVEHVVALSPDQRAALAVALTDLHSRRFDTPRVFVNVRYTDSRSQPVFRGGRPAVYNRVVLRTRVGESRTKEVYDDHCRDIVRAWEEIVCPDPGAGAGAGAERNEPAELNRLRTVWVLGALTTAVECGIARPRVSHLCLSRSPGLTITPLAPKRSV